MSEDAFTSMVNVLADRIIEETTVYIDSEQISEITREYTSPDFYEFDYQPFGIQYSVSFSPEIRTEWIPSDQSQFIREIIEQLKEYKEVQDAIPKEFHKRSVLFRPLHKLANNVASKVYEGTINDVLPKYISIFVSDLKDDPIKWACKSWLSGIWLEEKPYEILPQLSIRRPEPIDLEEAWVISIDAMKSLGSSGGYDPLSFATLNPGSRYGHLRTPRHGGFGFHIIPKLSAILEFTYKTCDRYEPRRQIDLILDCLTFFGTGAAFQIKTEMSPISFAEMPHTYYGPVQIPLEYRNRMPAGYGCQSAYYQYMLHRPDVPKIVEFIKAMQRLYPGEGIVYGVKTDSPVRIAFSRYQSAFLGLQGSGLTGQITSSMMALEALLLKETEGTELSHKLSQRTSVLMEFFGWHPYSVYQDIKKSYGIRSKYVHGSIKRLASNKDAMERSKRALAYTRNTLLLFLLLRRLDNNSKEAFINEIDESLISQDKRSELRNKIPKQIWLCHPR